MAPAGKITNNTDIFIPPRYMVDPLVGAGTHVNVQSAIISAHADFLASGSTTPITVYVRDGIYTENLSPLDGVVLTGAGQGAQIVGNHLFPNASFNIQWSNLNLKCINGNPLLHVLPGVANQFLQISDCTISVDNTGGGGPTLWAHISSSDQYSFVMKNCTVNMSNGGAVSCIFDGTTSPAPDGYIIQDCIFNSVGYNDIFQNALGSHLVMQGCTTSMKFDCTTVSQLFLQSCNMIAFGDLVTVHGNSFCVANFCDGQALGGSCFVFSDNTNGFIHKFNGTSSAASMTIAAPAHVNVDDYFIFGSTSPSITGTGVLSYSHISALSPANTTFDPALSIVVNNVRPYSTAGINNASVVRGHCSFDSAVFSVDTEGFVTSSGTGIGNTITGNTGGALPPTAGNWNIFGNSGSFTSGSGSTLTVKSPPYSDQGGPFSIGANTGSFSIAAIAALPASGGLVDGDLCEIVVTAGVVVIQAAAGQTINIGNLPSTVGGTATSTLVGDSVSLRWQASSLSWWATSVIGTFLMA